MNLAIAIPRIRPGALWCAPLGTYESIVWIDTNQTQPTLAEVVAAWDAYIAETPAREAAEAQAAQTAATDANNDAIERAVVKGFIVALKNGTGTTLDRLVRTERVCAYLLKHL